MSEQLALPAASSQLLRVGAAPFKNKNNTQRNSPGGQSPAFGQRGQGFSFTCRGTGKHDAFWSGEVSIRGEGHGLSQPLCQGVPVSCQWVARGCLSQGGDSLGSLPSGQAARGLAVGPWGASSSAPQPAPSFRPGSPESLQKGAAGGTHGSGHFVPPKNFKS